LAVPLVGVKLPCKHAAIAVVKYAFTVQHVLLPNAFVSRAVDERVYPLAKIKSKPKKGSRCGGSAPSPWRRSLSQEPQYTSPFWNVIIPGTGSEKAERQCKHVTISISSGQYRGQFLRPPPTGRRMCPWSAKHTCESDAFASGR
jgi:hypothetical protein